LAGREHRDSPVYGKGEAAAGLHIVGINLDEKAILLARGCSLKHGVYSQGEVERRGIAGDISVASIVNGN
jgi:hypothetical protein